VNWLQSSSIGSKFCVGWCVWPGEERFCQSAMFLTLSSALTSNAKLSTTSFPVWAEQEQSVIPVLVGPKAKGVPEPSSPTTRSSIL
jgi:hypothetical protein